MWQCRQCHHCRAAGAERLESFIPILRVLDWSKWYKYLYVIYSASGEGYRFPSEIWNRRPGGTGAQRGNIDRQGYNSDQRHEAHGGNEKNGRRTSHKRHVQWKIHRVSKELDLEDEEFAGVRGRNEFAFETSCSWWGNKEASASPWERRAHWST